MIISHFVFLVIVQLACCYKRHVQDEILFPCGSDLTSHRNWRLLGNNRCGLSGPLAVYKIVGGEMAQEHEFPWMAMLLSFEHGRYRFRCGGAIINEMYILTAAHCLSPKVTFIRVGDINSYDLSDCFGENCHARNIAVERLIYHERYDNRTNHNDIALIRLKEKIKFDDYKRPICLPTFCDVVNKNFDGKKLLAAGWGGNDKNGTPSSISWPLLKVEVIAMSREACWKRWGPWFNPLSQICTRPFDEPGAGAKGTYSGDSGGPLAFKDSRSRYFAVGVSSGGYVAKDFNISLEIFHKMYMRDPPVFTRVSHYMFWILDNIKQ